MRFILGLAFVMLVLSGCAGSTDDSSSSTSGGPGMARMVPADIWDNKTITASLDPTNVAGEPICTSPTAQCIHYPFTTTENSTHIEATLSWALAANDFDFYIYQGTTEVLAGANPIDGGPTNSESMVTDLGKGDYEIIVVGWGVVQDTYALHATFS